MNAPSQKLVPLFLAGLIFLGCIRIVLTAGELDMCTDEPAHIACGMELLDKGQYRYEPQHPPITRVMGALGPYLLGGSSHDEPSMWDEGRAILYDGDYRANLRAARMGNLVFFLLACVSVFTIGRMFFGPRTGLWATAIFTFMPNVLGHAGFATTDMGVTAFYAAAVVAFHRWLKLRTWPSASILGVLSGLAVFSKFSSILFLAVGFVAVFAVACVRRRGVVRSLFTGRTMGQVVFSALVLLCIGWASYGFSMRPVIEYPADAERVAKLHAKVPFTKYVTPILERTPIPLQELVRGVFDVAWHNATGHKAYLLGEIRKHGWWYYYPLVLAFKVPVAVMLLFAGGAWALRREDGEDGDALVVLAVPGAVVLSSMLVSNINIGIRHILPMYPFVAVVCGYGLQRALAGNVLTRGAAAAVLAVFAVTSVAAHPDYGSFFNVFTRHRPHAFLVDSDLDWGQYLGALTKRLSERGIEHVSVGYCGSADLSRHGLPEFVDLREHMPPTLQGWVAVNVQCLHLKDEFHWLQQYAPVEVIRKTFFLYYFADPVPTGAQ